MASAPFHLLLRIVDSEALALEAQAIEAMRQGKDFTAYTDAALEKVKEAQEYHAFRSVVDRLVKKKEPYAFVTITT